MQKNSLPPVSWRWVEEGDGYVGRLQPPEQPLRVDVPYWDQHLMTWRAQATILLDLPISPANVVGKAHWYSDKLTVRGMVPWRQTMVRIPAGAQCEWCWARATTLIKTPAKKIGRGGPEPWSGCTYPPFLNPPPVHWW
jgi:hypothetical protein